MEVARSADRLVMSERVPQADDVRSARLVQSLLIVEQTHNSLQRFVKSQGNKLADPRCRGADQG